MNSEGLARRFRRALQSEITSADLPALTGFQRSDGTWTLFGDSANGDALATNEVYARLHGNAAERKVVMNTAVIPRVNIWVIVRLNRNGRYEIIRPMAEENTQTYGEAATSFGVPNVDGSVFSNLILYARNLDMGRIRLYQASTLKIVADNFLYTDTAGALKMWTVDNGRLDLTSSVPSSGNHTLALIALNPDASAPALTVSTLTARALGWPFIYTDLASFSLTAGYYPLATIELKAGDTTITADRIDYNIRQFLVPKLPTALTISGGTIDGTPIGATTPSTGKFTSESVKAGNSTTYAKVGGAIFDDYADVGNSGTSETDLFTHTLTASTFNANGDTITWDIYGTSAGSATATTQLRLYVGGTQVADSGAVAISTADTWLARLLATRVSSSVVRVGVEISFSGGVTFSASPFYTEVTGLTLTNTQVIKITGTRAGVGAASNDILAKQAKMLWQPGV